VVRCLEICIGISLKESFEITENAEIEKSYKLFVKIAESWKEVFGLFFKAGESKKIKNASEILVDIADKEQKVMKILLAIGKLA